MKQLCKVYRSTKKEGAYLIVDAKEGFERVPEALLNQFGKPEEAMTLVLTPDKKMARTTGADVMKALEEQGFYFQLPPLAEQAMKAIAEQNSKLAR